MDEEELDKGITWKELLWDLKDRVKVELKDDQLAWINLILNLFREKGKSCSSHNNLCVRPQFLNQLEHRLEIRQK
jgi:hypothetical protein